MSKKNDLMQKRAAIHAEMTGKLNADQTPEIRAAVRAMIADIDLIGEDIKVIERADAQAAELAAAAGALPPAENRGGADPKKLLQNTALRTLSGS